MKKNIVIIMLGTILLVSLLLIKTNTSSAKQYRSDNDLSTLTTITQAINLENQVKDISLSQIPQNIDLKGQVGGTPLAIFFVSPYAYVGIGGRLVILDVSKPDEPTFVAQTELFSGAISAIVVDEQDNQAYVAAGEVGLYSIDVSNPSEPGPAFRIATGNVTDVGLMSRGYDTETYKMLLYTKMEGGLYVDYLGKSKGLEVINFGDGDSPRKLAIEGPYAYVLTYNWTDGHKVHKINFCVPTSPHYNPTDDYFLAPEYPGGMDAYNIQILEQPLSEGSDVSFDYIGENLVEYTNKNSSINDSSNPHCAPVELFDAVVYITDWQNNKLHTYMGVNSNPTNPIEYVTTFTNPSVSNVNDVDVIGGGLAYVATNYGLYVLKGLPSNFMTYDIYRPSGWSYFSVVEAIGNRVFLLDTEAGYNLRILNRNDTGGVNFLGLYEHLGVANNVVIQEDYAYVASETQGLQVVDISSPQSPEVVGIFDSDGWITDVTVDGETAYLSDSIDGFRIVDIGNPITMTETISFSTGGNINSAAILDDWAYIVDGNLHIFDISHPGAIEELVEYETPGWASGVDVISDTAFVADGGSGLRILNVIDPITPTLPVTVTEIGFFDTAGFASRVVISGTNAFISDGNAGLQILDISNPVTPTLIGFYDPGGYTAQVKISGDIAYLAHAQNGLHILDISDPSSPFPIEYYETPGWANGVDVGENIVVADRAGGLIILDHDTSPLSEPVLNINHTTGQSGSFFTVVGQGFPINSTATIEINGVPIGTVITNQYGRFSFILDSSLGDPGFYYVTVSVNPSATVAFTIDSSASLWTQEGSGIIFDIPTGIAYTNVIYLSFIQK